MSICFMAYRMSRKSVARNNWERGLNKYPEDFSKKIARVIQTELIKIDNKINGLLRTKISLI